MVRFYPVRGEAEPQRKYITWIGDDSERRICDLCKTTKLNRSGRFYICPTCNQRTAIADLPEEIHVDRNISKLDVKPAIVFKDKSVSTIRRENEKLLEEKYSVDKFEDDAVLKQPGVTIKKIYDHEV